MRLGYGGGGKSELSEKCEEGVAYGPANPLI